MEPTVEAAPPVATDTVSRPARKEPLPALTGIRTVLALTIILFHFTPPHLGVFRPIVENGFVFVNVFFLISGFILTYNYGDRGRSLRKRDFWVARFSRLYPVYLLVLILSLKMLQIEWQARSHQEFWQGLVLTPLLLHGLSPSLATFWNTVAWTLSCEVVFYALFPWLIRLPWPKTPSRLLALMVGLWVIDLAPSVLYLAINPEHLSGPVDRYTSTTLVRFLKYTPLPYAAVFLAGMTIAKLQGAVKITRERRMTIAAFALGALAVFFTFAADRVPYLVLHGGLLLPLFATMIFGLAGEHPIASIFAWKPILLIGESTYCLYLLHFNVFILLHMYHVPERLHLEWADPWISYVVLVLLAIAVYKWFENPARKAILKWWGPARRASA